MTAMSAQLPLRLARSAAFAAVCAGLAVAAHTTAGGPPPGETTVVGGGVLVFLAAFALAGRERSPAVVGVTLGGAQLGLHELFGAATASSSSPAHQHGSALGASLGMLLAHTLATAVTGWWLARGEAALWSLLRQLGARLLRRPRLPLLPAVRRAAQARPGWTPSRGELRHVVSRRGPPLPA